MGHERKQTLNLIEALAQRFIHHQHQQQQMLESGHGKEEATGSESELRSGSHTPDSDMKDLHGNILNKSTDFIDTNSNNTQPRTLLHPQHLRFKFNPTNAAKSHNNILTSSQLNSSSYFEQRNNQKAMHEPFYFNQQQQQQHHHQHYNQIQYNQMYLQPQVPFQNQSIRQYNNQGHAFIHNKHFNNNFHYNQTLTHGGGGGKHRFVHFKENFNPDMVKLEKQDAVEVVPVSVENLEETEMPKGLRDVDGTLYSSSDSSLSSSSMTSSLVSSPSASPSPPLAAFYAPSFLIDDNKQLLDQATQVNIF